MATKLSPAQQNILNKMANGWELGVSHSIGARRCWLQQDGIGEGGKSEDVRYSTMEVLFERGLNEQVPVLR